MAQWDSSCGTAAGHYDFINVVRSGQSRWHNRYFVDLNFMGQFEIPRPTSEYLEFLSYVPRIFVGRAMELKHTIRILSSVANRGFREKGLTVPPWRKKKYM